MAKGFRVEGLEEIARAVGQLDGEMPKVIKNTVEASADMTAEGAGPLFPVMRGRARASVRSKARRGMADVVIGGGRAPHAPWLEWGGAVGRRNSVTRAYVSRGRYVGATVDRFSNAGEFEEVGSEALTDAARRAGIVVD